MDFTSSASAAVSASSLNSPGGLAAGPNGNLFVADSGNNRVVEYAAGAGNGSSAIRVYGQPSMSTAVRQTQPSAQSLSAPQSIAVDQASSLYVADAGANRILIFPTTQNQPPAGATASFVIGQSNFGSSGANGLRSPVGVALDSVGNIYVSDSGNNRVLIYPSLVFLPVAGGSPSGVVGQQSASGTTVNWDSTDGQATANGLAGPLGVWIDRQDTLYVADALNHRVVQFLKPASVVNAATFQGSVPVAPGGLATLFSNGLAVDKTLVSTTTWPTTASNRQLVINDQLAGADVLHRWQPGELSGALQRSRRFEPDRCARSRYRRTGGGRQQPAGWHGFARHLHGEPERRRTGAGAEPGQHHQLILEPGQSKAASSCFMGPVRDKSARRFRMERRLRPHRFPARSRCRRRINAPASPASPPCAWLSATEYSATSNFQASHRVISGFGRSTWRCRRESRVTFPCGSSSMARRATP